MPRQKTDFLLDQLTDGGFATVDAFRRSVEAVCRRLHEEGWTISLGTSSDKPVYLVEDIDLAEPGDVEDALDVELEDVRISASWNAMAVHMRANNTCYAVADGAGTSVVLLRIHPDFDVGHIKRLGQRHKRHERDRRLRAIERDVALIREALSRQGLVDAD